MASKKFKKPKSNEERFDKVAAAQAFLDAAHGFDTSKPDSGKSMTFAKLVVKAESGQLTTKHELTNTFGIDLSKARKNQSTGVTSEDRDLFMYIIGNRALNAGAVPATPANR